MTRSWIIIKKLDNNTAAYPLNWPVIYPRTPANRREKARFSVSFAVGRDALLEEIRLMGATQLLISSNIQLRRDGLPYANMPEPSDPGVAVYFRFKSKDYALSCDRWTKTKDNIRAIGLHIASIRSIERWVVGSIEQAFTGYLCLPPSTSIKWWEVLGVDLRASDEEVKAAYRVLARLYHPDGEKPDSEKIIAVNAAYEKAKLVAKKCRNYQF